MPVKPLGGRVVIRPAEAKDEVKGGIIIPDTAKEKPQEGEIIALGTGRVLDDGTRVDFSVKIGDKVLFSKYGGNLGTSGSVAYHFDRKGVLEIDAEGMDEMALLDMVAEAGAEDLELDGDTFVVTTPVETFGSVQAALREMDIAPREAIVEYVATTSVSLPLDEAQKVVRLIEALEDIDDVQAVYTTLNFDEATLAAVS